MKTLLKYLGFALLAVTTLVLVLALAGIGLIYHKTTTPAAPEPAAPLLSHLRPLPAIPTSAAPWERAARADQAATFDLNRFEQPGLEYGPWTRWWWPGNVVEATELQREIQVFADQGFGGVEIQPIATDLSDTDKQDARWLENGWDSPEFYANVRATLDAAQQAGMRVDLTAGSGWPSGGPHIGLQDGMQQIVHGETVVEGGKAVRIKVPEPAMPLHWKVLGWLSLIYPQGGFIKDEAELLTVVAGRVKVNERSRNPLNIHDQITLFEGDNLVLDDHLDAQGNIVWDAPQGEWAIIAFYRLPGAELGGAALPQASYVVDHFDRDRLQAHYNYLFREETGLLRYAGDTLRAFFNDSFEFKQERLFPRGQLQHFEDHYDYDARPLLPALVQSGHDFAPFHWAKIEAEHEYDTGANGRRFEQDWERLISETFIDNMLVNSRDWARRHALASRAQAYGFELDLIKAAGSASIPETEQQGGSMLFMKMPSSGALLYGRPIVTAESFIHKRRAWLSTPAKIKAQAQQLFAAGVNQIIYHGSPYQIQDSAARGYGDDGWYPFTGTTFSEDFSEQHPHWQQIAVVNGFIARQQYLMRLGKPETDVLVYYPWLGFPLEGIGEDAFLVAGQFDGEPAVSNATNFPIPLPAGHVDKRERWLASLYPLLQDLERRGLSWQWLNPESAAALTVQDGKPALNGSRFHAVLLHDIPDMPLATAKNLQTLADNGAKLVRSGKLPQQQTGLVDAANGDAQLRQISERLTASSITLDSLAPGPVSYSADGIQQARRRLQNGDVLVYLNNTRKQAITLPVVLQQQGKVSVLDSWNQQHWPANTRNNNTIELQLPAYGSRTLLVSNTALPDNRDELDRFYANATEVDRQCIEQWQLALENKTFKLQNLVDWRTLPEPMDTSATGSYRAQFTINSLAENSRYRLDIEDVYGIAEAKLNGKSLGEMLVYPFQLDITEALQTGDNQLEIIVTPPRRNGKLKGLSDSGANLGFGSTERTSNGIVGEVHVTRWQAP